MGMGRDPSGGRGGGRANWSYVTTDSVPQETKDKLQTSFHSQKSLATRVSSPSRRYGGSNAESSFVRSLAPTWRRGVLVLFSWLQNENPRVDPARATAWSLPGLPQKSTHLKRQKDQPPISSPLCTSRPAGLHRGSRKAQVRDDGHRWAICGDAKHPIKHFSSHRQFATNRSLLE